jgi:hypothetical protein
MKKVILDGWKQDTFTVAELCAKLLLEFDPSAPILIGYDACCIATLDISNFEFNRKHQAVIVWAN